jgi:AraC family transcriptional regulator
MGLETPSDFHGRSLMRRDVTGLTVQEVVYSRTRIRKHVHERAHLGFVLSGSFDEDCEGKNLDCQPLTVSFLPPWASHSDDFRGKARCLFLELSPERLTNVQEYLNLDEPLNLTGPIIRGLTTRLHYEARQSDKASALAIEGLALEVWAEFSRQLTPFNERKPPRWLRSAQEMIHANFAVTTTHDEIANLAGVHPVHLAREFRRHYGCTIGEYVRRLRVEFACRILSTSETSLSEIAHAAGFADQSHFTKVFRKQMGASPAQFRASCSPMLMEP